MDYFRHTPLNQHFQIIAKKYIQDLIKPHSELLNGKVKPHTRYEGEHRRVVDM